MATWQQRFILPARRHEARSLTLAACRLRSMSPARPYSGTNSRGRSGRSTNSTSIVVALTEAYKVAKGYKHQPPQEP